MEFEMRQTGLNPGGKPTYESAEEAFGRCACELMGLKYEKIPKMMKVTLPPTMPGKQPIETTMMRPCLPSPAEEICEHAEGLFNQEQDIAYRMGYIRGYKDKDEKKERDAIVTLTNTPKTSEFAVSLHVQLGKMIQDPLQVAEVEAIFDDALSVKREQGFANGYWQGYNDRAGNVMPKYHYWDDANEEAKKFEW